MFPSSIPPSRISRPLLHDDISAFLRILLQQEMPHITIIINLHGSPRANFMTVDKKMTYSSLSTSGTGTVFWINELPTSCSSHQVKKARETCSSNHSLLAQVVICTWKLWWRIGHYLYFSFKISTILTDVLYNYISIYKIILCLVTLPQRQALYLWSQHCPSNTTPLPAETSDLAFG